MQGKNHEMWWFMLLNLFLFPFLHQPIFNDATWPRYYKPEQLRASNLYLFPDKPVSLHLDQVEKQGGLMHDIVTFASASWYWKSHFVPLTYVQRCADFNFQSYIVCALDFFSHLYIALSLIYNVLIIVVRWVHCLCNILTSKMFTITVLGYGKGILVLSSDFQYLKKIAYKYVYVSILFSADCWILRIYHLEEW